MSERNQTNSKETPMSKRCAFLRSEFLEFEALRTSYNNALVIKTTKDHDRTCNLFYIKFIVQSAPKKQQINLKNISFFDSCKNSNDKSGAANSSRYISVKDLKPFEHGYWSEKDLTNTHSVILCKFPKY